MKKPFRAVAFAGAVSMLACGAPRLPARSELDAGQCKVWFENPDSQGVGVWTDAADGHSTMHQRTDAVDGPTIDEKGVVFFRRKYLGTFSGGILSIGSIQIEVPDEPHQSGVVRVPFSTERNGEVLVFNHNAQCDRTEVALGTTGVVIMLDAAQHRHHRLVPAWTGSDS